VRNSPEFPGISGGFLGVPGISGNFREFPGMFEWSKKHEKQWSFFVEFSDEISEGSMNFQMQFQKVRDEPLLSGIHVIPPAS
jgi:hypothetical protein